MISQNKQKGFTIVELLIVIVVIGILAAISIVAYNSVTQKARDTERATNAGNLVKAISGYNAQNNGKWLLADDINPAAPGTPSALASWKDPEIPEAVLKQVHAGAPAKDKFQVVPCPTGATGDAIKGVEVLYYKEADTANPGKVKAGSC